MGTTKTEAGSFTRDVKGGWGHESITFTLGINSGSGGIGFGVSDQQHAIRTGSPQTVSTHMSLTPDDAEAIGRSLIAHAEAVRARVAERLAASAADVAAGVSEAQR
jgi:hypothetical protein